MKQAKNSQEAIHNLMEMAVEVTTNVRSVKHAAVVTKAMNSATAMLKAEMQNVKWGTNNPFLNIPAKTNNPTSKDKIIVKP